MRNSHRDNSEWPSVEQWDKLGYWVLMPAFFWFALSDPEFLVFLFFFAFPVFLIWASIDRTK